MNTFACNRQQKGKIQLYFGNGLVIFVGCLAICLVFLMEYSIQNLILCFINFTLHGILSFCLTFPESEADKFELVPQQFGLVDGAIFIIYSFAILAFVEIGHEESQSLKTFLKIWFSMLILWGVHGIWQARNGIVVLKHGIVYPTVQRALFPPAMTKPTVSSITQTPIEFETLLPARPECKICFREYTETSRAPRILEKCYHTACEACLNSLLAQNDYKYVQCPFCQMATAVNGAARKLPKNYAVLDTIQE